jgi:hypothetical protein
MADEWIEDSARPGGIGRGERERVFWERVASGRASGRPQRSADDEKEIACSLTESPWESAQLAVVTMLTVVLFGLGWVSLELERLPSISPEKISGTPSGILSGTLSGIPRGTLSTPISSGADFFESGLENGYDHAAFPIAPETVGLGRTQSAGPRRIQ